MNICSMTGLAVAARRRSEVAVLDRHVRQPSSVCPFFGDDALEDLRTQLRARAGIGGKEHRAGAVSPAAGRSKPPVRRRLAA